MAMLGVTIPHFQVHPNTMGDAILPSLLTPEVSCIIAVFFTPKLNVELLYIYGHIQQEHVKYRNKYFRPHFPSMTGHFGFGQTHGTACKLPQKTMNPLKSKNIKSGNLCITVNSAGTECYDVLSMREK